MAHFFATLGFSLWFLVCLLYSLVVVGKLIVDITSYFKIDRPFNLSLIHLAFLSWLWSSLLFFYRY